MCPSCGTRPEEWDEELGGDEYAYVAEERRCLGCEAIEDARQSVPEDANRKGLHFVLIPWRESREYREPDDDDD